MAKAANEPVTIGLFGTGLIGQTHSLMLKRVAKLGGGAVRIASIYGHDQAAARQTAEHWPGAKIAASAQEILESPVDAVYICTPTRSHRELCLAAAAAKKHVFCEKPLAMKADEGAEMLAALEKAGVVSQVGLVMRYAAAFWVIKEMIEAPESGRLISVTMRDDQDFPTRGVHASSWRGDPAQTAGGALAEHSIHDLDMLSWLFGPVKRLNCTLRNLNDGPGIEDYGAVDLEFASGAHGRLTSVWHKMIGRPSERRFEVFCENLHVACEDGITSSLFVYRDGGGRQIAGAEVKDSFARLLLAQHPSLQPFGELLEAPYGLEDALFVNAVLGRCEAWPTIADGVAAQRLVEAAYESARQAQALKLTN